VPPGSCRVIAVRAVEAHPVLVSTSRHVTQGMVDVTGEVWDGVRKTLSGTSQVVGGDPYELRVAGLDAGGKKWQLAGSQVGWRDRQADVSITATPVAETEAGWARVKIRTKATRAIHWTLQFTGE